MAEGLLGGALTDDDEKPEVEAADALAGAEAFASAVAAMISQHDPGVARRTEDFLVEQTQLLRAHTRHWLGEGTTVEREKLIGTPRAPARAHYTCTMEPKSNVDPGGFSPIRNREGLKKRCGGTGRLYGAGTPLNTRADRS